MPPEFCGKANIAGINPVKYQVVSRFFSANGDFIYALIACKPQQERLVNSDVEGKKSGIITIT
ncbi:hypothetical protein [Mucilaginibacter aquaedulcis]|uniref:hypothetical protein n=1 Tax=Mucilaginibacter aquaedulcis TaxID=1187081 RepID=UPI0025B2D402|nr:hypothetical protein [Mucilaginibacter aquaedulcis]MDN3551852.1 hypothetical protein [Mucilaginibacter aquaedulcis]